MDQMLHPKSLLLKLSGEALQGDNEYGIKVETLNDIASKVVSLLDRGIKISIVIGGGNIFRGVSGAAKGIDRASADYMGMLATIMNGIALGDAIEKLGKEVRIMSAMEIPRVAEVYIRRRALKHLDKGRVVICVAGTGNPYFTTDSAAVLRALELGCDMVVKGTKVDGVYDKDPMKFDDAKKYQTISMKDALQQGLRIMDQSAIALAKDEKMPIMVCRISDIDKIGDVDLKSTFVYIEK